MTPERLLLKRATVEMVKGVGGQDAAALFTRVRKSMLSDYGNENRPDLFAPIDVIVDLEPLAQERSGWPHVTQALCKLMGGTFVPEPDARATEESLLAVMSRLSTEFAEVTSALCTGLADKHWCEQDGAELESQLNDVIRVAIQMRALARSTEGKS